MIRKQHLIGNVALVVAYGYDSFGRPASITYSSGRTVTYTYTAGQVSGVAVDGTHIATGISYFPFGGPKAWTWGNAQT